MRLSARLRLFRMMALATVILTASLNACQR